MMSFLKKSANAAHFALRRAGYQQVLADEMPCGRFVAEYSLCHAGVTVRTVVLHISPKGRVVSEKWFGAR